jgi:hypothetical protein
MSDGAGSSNMGFVTQELCARDLKRQVMIRRKSCGLSSNGFCGTRAEAQHNERVVRSRDTSPRSIEEKFASSGTVSPHEVTDEREEFRGGEVFTDEAIHMFHGLGSRTRVDHDRYIHFYLLELAG